MSNLLYDHLKNSPIFANLDPFMFQILEQHLVFQELVPNEILFNEGEHGDYLAFVLLGNLAILKNNANDSGLTQIGNISQGDSIGEMALIDMLTRSATVKASELTALVKLSKKDFETILTDYPRIGIEILRGIAVLLSLKLRRTSENLSRSNNTQKANKG